MTIDHTYFTSINSCEKAYMLGLIVFNIKENSSDKIIVEIDLKIDKIKGTDVELSYNMYNKLNIFASRLRYIFSMQNISFSKI